MNDHLFKSCVCFDKLNFKSYFIESTTAATVKVSIYRSTDLDYAIDRNGLSQIAILLIDGRVQIKFHWFFVLDVAVVSIAADAVVVFFSVCDS